MNFSTDVVCRRCEAALAADDAVRSPATPTGEHGRSLGRWLLWIAGVTVAILGGA